MARLTVGVVFGLVVGVLAGAALGIRASEDDVALAAAEAGVDETDLRGAVNTTGLGARQYLTSVGELPQAGAAVGSGLPAASVFDRRIECLIRYESGGNPYAVNRSSGASGLLQFLPSTWRSTPQGRAGMSVFDAVAARAAAAWMLSQGRAREWVPVQRGLC
jgi:hypothetical protein